MSKWHKSRAGPRRRLSPRCSVTAKRTERLAFEHAFVFACVLGEVDAEVREREVGDGDAGGEVFDVDDPILELSNCERRYSRSFIGLPDCASIRFSSPLADTSSRTILPLTRCSRLM